ncbi:MAG: beta strand repeat-containing protein [Candidatus Sumerlaeaceae bacterium]
MMVSRWLRLCAAFSVLACAFTGVSAPSVTSIVLANPTPTNAATVNFTVTFDEAVTGVADANFTLSGSVSGLIGNPSTSDQITWNVDVSSVAGDGLLGLDLSNAAGITAVSDSSALSNTLAGDQYDIDNTQPVITSFDVADPTPTSADTVNFTFVVGEQIVTLSDTNFALVATGTVGGTIGTPTSLDNLTWTIPVTLINGDGTLALQFNNSTNAQDDAGNEVAGAQQDSATAYDIDNTQPVITSFDIADPTPTNATTLNFTFVVDEATTGLSASNFVILASGVTGTIGTPTTSDNLTWTIPVTGVTGSGTLGLRFNNSTGAEDVAGNEVAGAPLDSATSYDVDQTAPTVVSFIRTDASPTNATALNYTLTFSEAVTTVTSSNFALTLSGVSATIGVPTTSDNVVWNVPISGVSGDGTLQLVLNDPTGIADSGTNGLTGTPAAGQVYDIDQTPPNAMQLIVADVSPTSATTINFTLTFSEQVTSVVVSSFGLTGTGVTGTIGAPATTDGGITWNIPVSSVSGNGTLGLDLTDVTGIADLAGNSLGAGVVGQLYDIDQTAPVVVSITKTDVSPTSATIVNFTLLFSETVKGVVAGSFNLSGIGVTGTVGIPTTTDAGLTWNIPVTSVSGSGTLGIDLSDITGIVDVAYNPLGAGATGPLYDVDQSAPVVSSISRADANPTSATSVAFLVTFSEAVSGVGTGSFSLATGGTAAGTIGSALSSDGGLTWQVIVSSVSGDGALGIDLTIVAGIQDAVGNPLVSGLVGDAYTIDQIAPTVISVLRADPNPTSASTLHFKVAFSEVVTTLTASNLSLVLSGVIATIGSITTLNQQEFDVTINSVSGTGTLGLDVVDGSSIFDAAFNALGGLPFTGVKYDVDQSGPQVVSIVRTDVNPTNATTLNWLVTFDTAVSGVTAANFSLAGAGVTGSIGTPTTNNDGTTWTVQVTLVSGTGMLGLDLSNGAGITDSLANALINAPFAGQLYNVDQTNPAISSITVTNVNPTSATTVNYTVTFTEAVSGVTSASFSLNLSGVTATIGVPTTANGVVWNVAVLVVTGNGTLRLDLTDPSGIVDSVGNPLDGTPFTGEVYSIDQTAPTVNTILLTGPNPTNATSLGFSVTFSEAVTTLTASNLTLTGAGVSGTISSIGTLDQITWSVTVSSVSGSGTLGLDLTSGSGILDLVGNPLAGFPVTGPLYTVDQTVPTALSLVRADTNPTSATTLNFILTFSEPVIGVTSASLTLSGGGVTGILSDPTTSDNITWIIAVTGVTGDGTLGVDLFDTTGIQDFQGNAVTAGIPGQQYDVDQTAPAVLSITRTDVNPTSATVLNFTVTFTEVVSGVTSASFTLSGVGVTGVLNDATTTDGINWNVAVTSVTGTGTLGVVLSNPAGIYDTAGNALASGIPGSLYDVDQTNPLALSLTRTDVNPTSASVVNFSLVFDEPMSGITSASLSIAAIGTTGTVQDPVTTDGVNWMIAVTGVSGNGTLGVDLTTTAGITDKVGNPLLDGIVGDIYTIDQTQPFVTAITLVDANPTTASVVRFDVTFSEKVTTLSISNLATSATGTAAGTITQVDDFLSSTIFRVTVSGCTGIGNLWVGVVNGAGVFDHVGNPLTGTPFYDEFYTFCGQPAPATNPTPVNGSIVPSSTSQLSWTAGAGAVSFEVWLDSTLIATTTGTSVNIAPQSPGTHNWRVDSDSGCGLSTTGVAWSFVILDPASGPVTPSDGARLCSSPARLEWNPAVGAVFYSVYIDNIFQATIQDTFYNPPPLVEGPHTWRVDTIQGSAIVPGPDWLFIILSNGLINPNVWRTDGQVYAIATGPNTIYIAGNFTYVLSPDNATWKQRRYIAAIDASTGIPTEFNPTANAPVYSLALDGTTLYAGGLFTKMGDQSRQRLAAIDANSTMSGVLPWNPGANGIVRALHSSAGSIYAGGDFTVIDGTAQPYVAEFISSGSLTLWRPTVSNNVYALASANNQVYVGGIFQSAGGQPYRGVAALDRTTGFAHTWANAAADLYVYALAYKNGRLFIGGTFGSMGGQPRRNLAAVDPTDGQVLPWNPIADRSVSALMVDNNTVFAGGAFTSIGTEAHYRLVGLHAITGAPVDCNYGVNNVVRALGNYNNTLYAGGDFTQVSTSNATGFAALGPLSTAPAAIRDWSLYGN